MSYISARKQKRQWNRLGLHVPQDVVKKGCVFVASFDDGKPNFCGEAVTEKSPYCSSCKKKIYGKK